jgi:hypothetical protein
MTLEQRIIKEFERDPSLIDNHEGLMLTVWLKSFPIEYRALPAHNLINRIVLGEIKDIPALTAINRVRQEVQENNPKYQGKLRTLRMEKASRTKTNSQTGIEKLI